MKKTLHTHGRFFLKLLPVLVLALVLPTANHFVYAVVASPTAPVPGTGDGAAGLARLNATNPVYIRGGTVNLAPNVAGGAPGQVQPLPTFSGINVPLIVNTAGDNQPVQIVDDVITHGVLDVHGGITNRDVNNGCDQCNPAYPLTIYDDAAITGAASITGPITANAATFNGTITGNQALVAGKAGLTSQITGNFNVIGGTTTLAGALNTTGNVTIGPAGGGAAILVVNGEVRSASVRTNNIIGGGATLSGDVTIGLAGGNNFLLVNGETRSTAVRTNSVLTDSLTANTDSTLLGNVTIGTAGDARTEVLTVNGTINGSQIGRFYIAPSAPARVDALPLNTWMNPTSTNCNMNDIQLSCAADFGMTNGTFNLPLDNFEVHAARTDTTNCAVYAKRTGVVAPAGTQKFIWAKAMCFSPNG